MGIVNVTPDSFSDGGRFLSADNAVEHALRLIDEGADIIDVGGESTRPRKKEAVTAQQEMDRVLPVIEGVRRHSPDAIISVDTYKASTAKAAVAAGAEIVNDVSSLSWDVDMAKTIAGLKCGAVLMHTRGRPEEWADLPAIEDPIGLVKRELGAIAASAEKAGIERERIVLDPGFGFGKRMGENYSLLARFNELHALGFALMSGTSRKSFVTKCAKNGSPSALLHGTLATVTASILQGAHIVRVHDVQPAAEAARVANAILAAS